MVTMAISIYPELIRPDVSPFPVLKVTLPKAWSIVTAAWLVEGCGDIQDVEKIAVFDMVC